VPLYPQRNFADMTTSLQLPLLAITALIIAVVILLTPSTGRLSHTY
jgi:hypothetical protein